MAERLIKAILLFLVVFLTLSVEECPPGSVSNDNSYDDLLNNSPPEYWEHKINIDEVNQIAASPNDFYKVECSDIGLIGKEGIDVWRINPDDSWQRLEPIYDSGSGMWYFTVYFFNVGSNQGMYFYYSGVDEEEQRLVIFASTHLRKFNAQTIFGDDWPPDLP